MSYRIPQLSPGTRMFVVQDQFPLTVQGASEDTEFLRTWLEADREEQPHGLNWSKISGLAMALAVSAGFWAGIVWLVNLIWK